MGGIENLSFKTFKGILFGIRAVLGKFEKTNPVFITRAGPFGKLTAYYFLLSHVIILLWLFGQRVNIFSYI